MGPVPAAPDRRLSPFERVFVDHAEASGHAPTVNRPTRIQVVQIVVLGVFVWLAIKVLVGMLAFGLLWGPG